MRILLPLHGFIGWNGGLDLIRLMTSALSHQTTADDVELHFAIPEVAQSHDAKKDWISRLRAARARRLHANADNTVALREIALDVTSSHPVITCRNNRTGILDAAKTIEADIIFPTMLPLGRAICPKIGYVYDFQHRYLPHLFSRRVRRDRDRQFSRIAKDSDGIVVNSRAVARDVARFLDFPAERILAMPFAPYVQPWGLDADPVDAQRKYEICAPYLLVCNHFWTHKDHVTAVRAFALVKKMPSYAELRLVLTGDPTDFRDAGHHARLVALCQELGIQNSTHFLGLIPKRDQIALLRGCSALLQPTLFEGGPGGGSVYDAIGLGIPVVVSDIKINREIDCGAVRFFHAGSADDLAKKITETLDILPSQPAKEELLDSSAARLTKLGDATIRYLQKFLR
jgi:glycosyltransferase involved in cell wall biosynthesis